MSSASSCRTGFLWSPLFETFDYGRNHPIAKGRFSSIRDHFDRVGLLAQANVSTLEAELLPEELLRQVHSPEYIKKVKMISETGVGEIDLDTPGFRGIYENARSTCGATITGVRGVLSGEIEHFYSPTGGFHHARHNAGGGFCVFNDVAAAVLEIKRAKLDRILVADFDVHHGNGTQDYFHDDPGVMQISFHEDPEWMYPHTGRIGECGDGPGKGYKINMPFPMDSGDAVYAFAFDELVPPLMEFYRPQFIIFLPGYDAHYLDRLAHLKLTTRTIKHVAERIHQAAHTWSSGRLGVLTGGGYSDDALLWGSGAVMSVLTGHRYEVPKETPPFEDNDEIWAEVRRNVEEIQQSVFPVLGLS